MKFIELSQGFKAIVDDDDFEYLNQWKWHVKIQRTKEDNKTRYYAGRGERYGPRCENKVKHIKMHRLILGIEDKNIFVDHCNGNTLDNRKENIRKATPAQNTMNSCKRISDKNSSGYKGVSVKYVQKTAGGFCYEAGIKLNGKRTYLGYFYSPVKAAVAYDRAALHLFGDYAKTNFSYRDKFGKRFQLKQLDKGTNSSKSVND
jgi:hypothetical protein